MSQASIKSRRRWFQFSLSALLVLTAVVGAAVAMLGMLREGIAPSFTGLGLSFILVSSCVLLLTPLASVMSRLPHWTGYVVTPLVYGLIIPVFYVFGEAIDQPRLDENWLLRAISRALHPAASFAIVGCALVVLDSKWQKGQARDGVYFANGGALISALSARNVRLALIVGFAPIAYYYGLTIIGIASANMHPHGNLFPPSRVFVSCLLIWGLLWLVDCWSRPQKGTIVAAVGFLCVSFLILSSVGFAVLTE